LIEDPAHITTQWFKNEGDAILLIGAPVDSDDAYQGLGGSAYLKVRHGMKKGLPPRCDLNVEKKIHDALRGWIAQGAVQSAHDCSEGGLAVTLAECCISGESARHTPHLLGAEVQLKNSNCGRLDALLYGETQGRIVISVPSVFVGKIIGQAELLEIPVHKIGTVGGHSLSIEVSDQRFEWNLSEVHDTWFNSINRIMES
ncbi:MAG: phosphoribosylformylglycinamidine synthase II, partial [Verrucomicrobia bacterium]|nr:phosphoribosylformylglycinamidine synthase II [Verrucomicrobiota bacterium]